MLTNSLEAAMTLTSNRPSSPAARAIGLVKTYGSDEVAVRALDDVNVEFERGRFTAVMGPSGSVTELSPSYGETGWGSCFSPSTSFPHLRRRRTSPWLPTSGGPGRPGMVRCSGRSAGDRRPAGASSE